MGHAPNILRNPRALADLLARLHSESITGWRRKPGGGVEPVNTVNGCLARAAIVTAKCVKVDGCYRRVEMDLVWLREHGFGDQEVYAMQAQYACARFDRCKLDWDQPRSPGGTPLVGLAVPPDHLLQFRCRHCQSEGYRRKASSLLAEFRRRGRPDAECVGALTLAARMSRACAQCGGREWKAIITELGAASDAAEEPEGDAAEPPTIERGMRRGPSYG